MYPFTRIDKRITYIITVYSQFGYSDVGLYASTLCKYRPLPTQEGSQAGRSANNSN
jgi:hypothetical protein